LRGTRGISDVSPVVTHRLQVNDPDLGSKANTGPATTPSQQDFWWANVPAAWSNSTGNPSVIVAVIDTGYDANNADVCSKVIGSAVFDLGNGVQDTATTAQDNDGHGTNVAGVAAADTNNTLRWAGVGYNVSLLIIRIFPHPPASCASNPATCPGASSADSAAAIAYAVSHGAKVINMSYGSNSMDAAECNALTSAFNSGLTPVGAAGNDGANSVIFPAGCNHVIAVGASAIDDYSTLSKPASPTEYVASYSDHGTGVTVYAPGGDPCGQPGSTPPTAPPCVAATPTGSANDYLQWVANNYSTTSIFGGGFHSALFAGTSQASPHVAGEAALLYSKNGGAATPTTVTSCITSHTVSIGAPHLQGRVDVGGALSSC
jgi:subtilisin family serine protease